MKLAPRIVTAALAAAIAIAVPFVTPAKPAEAAVTPDVWVEFKAFEPTVGLNAIPKAKFWIHSSKAESGMVVAYPRCLYLTSAGLKELPASPFDLIPNIGKNHARTYRIECGMYQGHKPMQVKLSVTAANEAQIDTYNNSKTVSYPGWFD